MAAHKQIYIVVLCALTDRGENEFKADKKVGGR